MTEVHIREHIQANNIINGTHSVTGTKNPHRRSFLSEVRCLEVTLKAVEKEVKGENVC